MQGGAAPRLRETISNSQNPKRGVCLGVHGVERESLAALGAFAGTADVRCDVAAPAVTGAKLLRNGLEYVAFPGRQLETDS